MAVNSIGALRLWRGVSAVLFVLLIGLIAPRIVTIVQLLSPSPLVIEDAPVGATVLIKADQTALWDREDCTSLVWKFEGIQSLYQDGQGTVGVGQEELCHSTMFNATFQDGSQKSYTIDLLHRGYESVNIAILIALMCLLAAFQFKYFYLPIGMCLESFFIEHDLIPLEIVFFVVAVVIGLIMSYSATEGKIVLFGDAGYYTRLSNLILTNGLENFPSDVRPYGYPLMIAVGQILPQPADLPYLYSVVLMQYGLLILTALLSMRLFMKMGIKNPPRWLKWCVFVLILWNPLLLGSVWDMLPDLYGMFLLTLGLTALFSKNRWRFFWLSAACAMMIVVKPLYLYWLVLLGILLIIYNLFYQVYLIQNTPWRDQLTEATRKIHVRPFLFAACQIIVPLLLILGMQFYHVWQHDHMFSLYGGTLNNEFIEIQLNVSVTWYKRETYFPGYIAYVDLPRQDAFKSFMESFSKSPNEGVLRFMATDIPGTLHMMGVRLIGLFQSYEWSTYRQNSFIGITYTFWWGLFALVLFVYGLIFWCRQGLGLRRGAGFANLHPRAWMVVFILIYSFVPIYALTNAEPRYLFPVLQLLTILGIATLYQERPRWSLIGAVIFSTIIYFYALQVLSTSQVIYQIK